MQLDPRNKMLGRAMQTENPSVLSNSQLAGDARLLWERAASLAESRSALLKQGISRNQMLDISDEVLISALESSNSRYFNHYKNILYDKYWTGDMNGYRKQLDAIRLGLRWIPGIAGLIGAEALDNTESEFQTEQ
jgi:hypothetical protein